EYTEQEQEDVCSALEWVAAQTWCTGSLGMIGLSWGGFAALQAAARRPAALKAVVALCASADRYGADVKYHGGCVLGCELLPWSSTMLAMSARRPTRTSWARAGGSSGSSGSNRRSRSPRRGSRTRGATTTGTLALRARTTRESSARSTPSAAGPIPTGRRS